MDPVRSAPLTHRQRQEAEGPLVTRVVFADGSRDLVPMLC
jgi:hypothetical protein